MPATVITGGHYGDEGKGKVVAYLALNDKPDVIARAGIGPNAGHTVYKDGKKFGLRMLPCGFVYDKARLLVGAGVLVNPEVMLREIEVTGVAKRFGVDRRCAIITQTHCELDKTNPHLKGKVGSTGTGCGPAAAERAMRTISLAESVKELSPYLTDVPLELNDALDKNKKVLVEASQGFGLSLYYGIYPYVTSKDTTASQAAADVGIGPTKVKDVIVVYKAYTTRVGEGPFATELTDEKIRKNPMWSGILAKAEKAGFKEGALKERIAFFFSEKGTVTGRPRRMGDFDFELARYSARLNGATQIAVTCLDRLFPESQGATQIADLPKEARSHVDAIAKKVGVPVTLISTGPNSEDLIDLRK
ncbi:Adenylosuccinate synthetase [uncultured archaeon]|nr:Adenylosuccinate synthetase [uncultured archaeon]